MEVLLESVQLLKDCKTLEKRYGQKDNYIHSGNVHFYHALY